MFGKCNILNLFFLFFIFCFSSLTYAQEYESMEHLGEITKDFVLKNLSNIKSEKINVIVNPSNTPLNLAKCSQDIGVEFPKNSNSAQITNVEITCNGETPWHSFLPVTVEIFNKVVIAKNTIAGKENITADDLDYALYDTNRLLGGYFKNIDEVVGNVSANLIPAGTIITKKNMTAPILVHKNQMITLLYQYNTIMITMQGIAKTDGALDNTVVVFNPSSKKTVEAVVVGFNKAQVIA